MNDPRKKSGVIYLSVFLLIVCGLSAILMATVKMLTEKPIAKAEADAVREGIAIVLEGVKYDNDPVADKIVQKKTRIFYPAKLNGKVVAYAVESHGVGYGGDMTGLIAFDADGAILRYIITHHNETPGIGTKVTDRIRVRTVTDLILGRPAEQGLPPNATLDSFKGLRMDSSGWRADKTDFVTGATERAKNGQSLDPAEPETGRIHFVSGATVTSKGVSDLAWRAAKKLKKYLDKENKK